jgi:ATP-grasp domain, R2K clade family 3
MSQLSVLYGRPSRTPDSSDRFEIEVLATEELRIESYALPLEPIVMGDVERALLRLPRPQSRTWLYRGWMLREEEYTALYEAIADRDEELIVDPESFAEATYAPNYLPLLGSHTAPARWTESDDIVEAWEVAEALGPPPWVVKDYVKSAKEEWYRACFVPEGADFEDFAAICGRLLELRAEAFETGFVVKKYLDLATLPGWMPDGRRVTDEHRLVFWEGNLVAHAPYHDVDSTLDDPAAFAFLGRTLSSPFFTADVARLTAGGWTIVEVNDGGSSTFPEQLDPREFYRAVLASRGR